MITNDRQPGRAGAAVNPAAYAVLDMAAAAHNLAVVRRHAPAAKVLAVVKANGYGHGALRMARALPDADGFAVARVDEGVRLRNAGIGQRIVVLEGFTFAEELELLLRHRLDAVVHSGHQLAMLAAQPGSGRIAVWLKLDTGMGRLGFGAGAAADAHRRLLACPVVRQPVRLMTHLANADDRGDAMTARQLALFERWAAGLPGERSVANSAALMAWPAALADWVRPGIALYGISPFADATGADLGLRPVMGLHSRLIAVKPLRPGDTVGYGATWRCASPTLMGVVAIGYGDGYPRHARPGTPVLVNGRRAPLIGRVSMDMITVDLGAQPQAKPGDKATLWGEGLPVEVVARCADTIAYTLVCGITQRVRIADAADDGY